MKDSWFLHYDKFRKRIHEGNLVELEGRFYIVFGNKKNRSADLRHIESSETVPLNDGKSRISQVVFS